MIYPCITLHMPWAYWVYRGWKTIETRTHKRFASLAGRQILIHASQSYQLGAGGGTWLTDEQVTDSIFSGTPLMGHIIAIAEVVEHRPCRPNDSRMAMIECRTPRFGLVLRNVRPLPKPIKAKGHQGIWYNDSARK